MHTSLSWTLCSPALLRPNFIDDEKYYERLWRDFLAGVTAYLYLQTTRHDYLLFKSATTGGVTTTSEGTCAI